MAPKDFDHVLPVSETYFSTINNADSSQSFTVRKSDLDLNKHVNNVKYIEWALSCLSDDWKVNEIDISMILIQMLSIRSEGNPTRRHWHWLYQTLLKCRSGYPTLVHQNSLLKPQL